jgi:voltage-gated potassium channel
VHQDRDGVSLRDKVRTVIFETNTPAGKAFDVGLIITILLSVTAVMLDSDPDIHAAYGDELLCLEWAFTILFTFEYAVRLWCINHPLLYARSFYGIVDLVGVLPTYLSLLFAGTQYLLVIRVLRVLRVFRVLRLVQFVSEAEVLKNALIASRRKITVFLSSVMAMVVVAGSLVYLVEGGDNGFTSIPKSIYWAVSTVTTVGYGDIVPKTPVGQALATLVMIMGYGVIAVPTGIVTMELNEAQRRRANTRTCPECSAEGHSEEAAYCWRCGNELHRRRDPRRSSADADLPEGL